MNYREPAADTQQATRSIVERFAREGGALIRTPITERYGSLVNPRGSRPLEPGFIPPDAPTRIALVSYYPNESDLGTPDYEVLRENFARWGRDGTVEAYRNAYNDWVKSLPLIPFYRSRMLPVLEAVGVAATEIAWLPLIKVPLPARSAPGDDLIWIDREVLWDQLRILQPPIIWIQGAKTYETVGPLSERITDKVVLQKLNQQQKASQRDADFASLIAKLAGYLAK